ncbi:MAG: type II toxin-antitoxin system VapC family toxin [Anaerolineae bacterium]|nr:type II toxin-antitoxin system VapC family toxin [Anaerolineae bacterium]
MKLIDTDILIDHFHGHRATLDFIAQQLVAGETLAISVVTVTEFSGGMRPGEETRTERLLSLLAILNIDEAIARQAGRYLREYRRSHRLELGDALIAATAQQAGAGLVTRNIKHYPMPDITILIPYERGRS